MQSLAQNTRRHCAIVEFAAAILIFSRALLLPGSYSEVLRSRSGECAWKRVARRASGNDFVRCLNHLFSLNFNNLRYVVLFVITSCFHCKINHVQLLWFDSRWKPPHKLRSPALGHRSTLRATHRRRRWTGERR